MDQNEKKNQTARDVMTPDPVTVASSDTLDQVARVMRERDTGFVPVCDDSKQILGLITDRDIVVRVVADGGDPSKTKVTQVMSLDPKCVMEGDSIDRIFQVMSEHQVRRVPVVNEKKELVGVVAQADIATRTQREEEVGQTVERISR